MAKNDQRFKAQEYNPEQVAGHLRGAEKKLKTARKIASDDEEAAYQLAYEAMLKASLSLLLRHGKRPRSMPGHHVAIIEMAGSLLGDDLTDMMGVFDDMRRNRNNFLYEPEAFVSTHQLDEALEIAEKYLSTVKKRII